MLRRISLESYRKMIDQGLLHSHGRIELHDGVLVKKKPMNPRHASVTRRLVALFQARLPEGWIAIKTDPIELPAESEGDSVVEPEVTIVAGTLDDYQRRHPGPGDVALLVEVTSGSRTPVRDAALERYARARRAVVWIVNLADDRLEIYTGPVGTVVHPEFSSCEIKRVGDVAETTIGGTVIAIPVADIVEE